jgi:hypothetical protein
VTSPRIAEQADTAEGAETSVVTGQDALDDLVALLDLERLEVNLFRGFSPAHSPTRVFGGQVAGQALVAAGRTVDPDRVVHSLHAYFVRPGDPRAPIIFDVERIRDGRSFTTRRVRAVQHGEVIFALAASFQLTQPGVEHTEPAPTGGPGAGGPARPRRVVARRADVPVGRAAPAGPALRRGAAVVGAPRPGHRRTAAGLDACRTARCRTTRCCTSACSPTRAT